MFLGGPRRHSSFQQRTENYFIVEATKILEIIALCDFLYVRDVEKSQLMLASFFQRKC